MSQVQQQSTQQPLRRQFPKPSNPNAPRLQVGKNLHIQTLRKRHPAHLYPPNGNNQLQPIQTGGPSVKKAKWISTNKIAKFKGELIFQYRSHNSPQSDEEEFGMDTTEGNRGTHVQKRVYAVLTPKKMELFETSKPFHRPKMICQSPVPTPTTQLQQLESIFDTAQQQQHLIMINEQQAQRYGNSSSRVGLIGKIYLCSQVCRGKVHVARTGKSSFRITTTKSGIFNQVPMTPVLLKVSDLKQQQQHNNRRSSQDEIRVRTKQANNDTVIREPRGTSRGGYSSQEEETITRPNMYMLDDRDEDAMMHDDGDENSRRIVRRKSRDVVGTEDEEIDESLVFHANTEDETNQWLTFIKQVISSLNNEHRYILDELLLYVFSYLDEYDLCRSVAPVSIKFYQLHLNEQIWSSLYAKKYEKKSYDIAYYSSMLRLQNTNQSGSSQSSDQEPSTPSTPSTPVDTPSTPGVGLGNNNNNVPSVVANPNTVSWKYVFTQRFQYEKRFLAKIREEAAQLLAQQQQQAQQAAAAANQNNAPAAGAPGAPVAPVVAPLPGAPAPLPTPAPAPVNPEEEERKRKKEEEERLRKEEEERKRLKSSALLKDGNALFNAADYEKDIATKRLLWVFCIDQYDACLIYNPSNWTAARNWAVALIRLEKLVSSYRGQEAQDYLRMILHQCVDKFAECMKLTPNNDEVLTLWAGFLSDLALKIHDPQESDNLFREAHDKFEQALKIRPYIGTYNDYGISFCDMAEKKIRQLKKKLKIATTTPVTATQNKSNNMGMFEHAQQSAMEFDDDEDDDMDRDGMDGDDDEENLTDEMIEDEKNKILNYLDNSSQLYEKCLGIKPDYFHAINNMGFNQKLKIDLLRIGLNVNRPMTPDEELQLRQRRRQLVNEACHFFSQCVNFKDFVIARNNWGNILLQEAKEQEGEERFRLLTECIEQYKRAMELEPSNDGCVCRCAIAYLMQAEIRLDQLRRARQVYQNMLAYGHQVKDQVLQQKQQVDMLTVDSERMYQEASNGFLRLKNRGLSLYNMSCLNAVFCKEEEAKKCLYEAYEMEILTVEKLCEDTDFDNIRDREWFRDLVELVRAKETELTIAKSRLALQQTAQAYQTRK